MEITRANFKSALPGIKSAITDASFISIDCEFSGLTLDTTVNAFDTYEQFYNKLKRNIKNFQVLQFGLGIFRYDEITEAFKQKCYNFYIFPQPINRNVPDRRFICQASSMDFLAKHNFDFNKVFQEGITYLNKSEETTYKQTLDERQKNRAQSAANGNYTLNPILIPDDDKEFVESTMNSIKTFLESDKDECLLPQCNSFRRRLIYQTTAERFNNKVSLETRKTDKREPAFYAMKPDCPEKHVEKEKKRCEEELKELEEAVGFSAVIQYISKSGKLVVGHNLCLDLLHTIDKFLSPLPDDYDEFKQCADCLFPGLIDTKYFASTPLLKELINNSVLGSMLEIFKNEPFQCPTVEVEEDGQGYTINDEKEHEAGYDAFITGVCFLTMVSYLAKEEQLYIEEFFAPRTKLLHPYLSKLFVLRLQDCPYINLSGKDPTPSRDHVLHVTFPKEWKTSELTQLFSPFGSIQVAWLNDTSAYIALHKRDQAALALSTLSQSDTYKVISYTRHQSMLKTNLPVAPSPAARKKREPETATGTHSAQTRKRRFDVSNAGWIDDRQSEVRQPQSVIREYGKLCLAIIVVIVLNYIVVNCT